MHDSRTEVFAFRFLLAPIRPEWIYRRYGFATFGKIAGRQTSTDSVERFAGSGDGACSHATTRVSITGSIRYEIGHQNVE